MNHEELVHAVASACIAEPSWPRDGDNLACWMSRKIMGPQGMRVQFSYLGGGLYSKVVDNPFDPSTVIKIGDRPRSDGWVDYALHCMLHPGKWKPRIYAMYLTKDIAVSVIKRYYAVNISQAEPSITVRETSKSLTKLFGRYNRFRMGLRQQRYLIDTADMASEEYKLGCEVAEDLGVCLDDTHDNNWMYDEGEDCLIATDPSSASPLWSRVITRATGFGFWKDADDAGLEKVHRAACRTEGPRPMLHARDNGNSIEVARRDKGQLLSLRRRPVAGRHRDVRGECRIVGRSAQLIIVDEFFDERDEAGRAEVTRWFEAIRPGLQGAIDRRGSVAGELLRDGDALRSAIRHAMAPRGPCDPSSFRPQRIMAYLDQRGGRRAFLLSSAGFVGAEAEVLNGFRSIRRIDSLPKPIYNFPVQAERYDHWQLVRVDGGRAERGQGGARIARLQFARNGAV